MRLAWSSPAALAMAPLQDLLNLGSEARMNVPGRADGNWRWRVREDMLSSQAFQWLQDLTESSKRSVSRATLVRAQVDREGATSFR
jgi:4-alpha-glucanotransferase